MAEESKNNESSLVPFEWALKDLAQPTLKEVGLDLRSGYKALKDITKNAIKKSGAGIANKRVAIEVLRSGGFVESSVGVEYFGGILASSKSEDGQDDGGIYYTDIIKSLSSKQLHLHYIIYNSLQKIFLSNPPAYSNLVIGREAELGTHKVFFNSFELDNVMELDLDKNIFALVQAGLIGGSFEVDRKEIEGKTIPYAKITPCVLGVQLYAVAYNKLSNWKEFVTKDFGDFEDIKLPTSFKTTMEELPDTIAIAHNTLMEQSARDTTKPESENN